MAQYIKIKLDGVKTIEKRINGVVGKVKDLKSAFKKIGIDFRETEKKVFSGQGSYGSRSSWKPLTPKYQEWKNQKYPGRPILQLTGNLKKSLTQKGQNHVELITKNSITLGSSDFKFKYHQKGNDKMVKRPPITFTHYQGLKWAKIIRNEILKGSGQPVRGE